MNQALETFISVYESRSFSIAAKELFVTQPTVSVRIEQLEKEMGTPLFVRKYRQEIIPTKAGDVLYRQAIRMRQLWRETQDEIRYVDDHHRRIIRLGFSQTLAVTTAPQFLMRAHEQLADFDWNITASNSEAISRLIDGKKLDMGIVEKPMLTDTSIVARKNIASDQLVRIGTPTGTWLIREPGSGIEHYTNLFFEEYDVIPEHTIVLNRNDLIMTLVQQGIGETVVSKSMLPAGMPYTALNPHFQRTLYFLYGLGLDKRTLETTYDLLINVIQQVYPD
ncbi:LysR family transcriptional regulator [Levilactobacillus bambusae]|uniref:LysR family transcriptional regulator n=1 Tax=Levilactobacillus bambusae TaxID=2024736 RepID=A0A2V1MY11_9LACO|nr:LysR family transcriptional regulator [Levilactobacillus bambusae]PWF99672.1 LysR family transcriptional regulator [Levilactobacillus bambusae]